MKKDYLKPEAEMLDIVTSVFIAQSNNVGEGDSNEPVIPLSNNSRGEWGNVWGK